MVFPTKSFSVLGCGFIVTGYIRTRVSSGGNWASAFDISYELFQTHALLQEFQLPFEFRYLLGESHSFLDL